MLQISSDLLHTFQLIYGDFKGYVLVASFLKQTAFEGRILACPRAVFSS